MRLLTVSCLLFLVHTIYAQQYPFARYTPKDGLISNRTRFLYQDRRGRLYISTFGGLSVYDGSRFLNYTTDNGLVASLVNDIEEMGDDSLWIIPNGRALHCLVHGVLKDIPTADHFYPVINQLLRCSDGYLYAIADEGLFRYERNRFVRVVLHDDRGMLVETPVIQGLEVNGHLLLVSDASMGAYPGPASLLVYNLQSHRLTVAARPPDYFYLLKAGAGEVFVATSAGVRRLDPAALDEDKLRLLPLPAPYAAANSLVTRYLYLDSHHHLWLTTDQGLLKLDGATGARQALTTANGLPPGQAAGLLEDKEGNYWIANDRNGIVKWSNRPIAFFPYPQEGFKVFDLCTVAGTDSVWFFDNRRPALLLLHDSARQLFLPEGRIPPGRLYMDRNSYIVAGNDLYALHLLPGHRFRASLLLHDSAFRFGSGCFDKKGNLILVSEKLVVIPAGKNAPVRRPLQFPLPYLCDQAAIDADGRIWTITRRNELFVFGLTGAGADLRLHLLASYAKGLPGSNARSITVDQAGRVYVGTRDHGLYCLFFDGLRFRSWQHLATGNGLSENFISQLECDADNTVWANTPAGLNRIRFEGDRFTVDNLNYSHDNYQGVYRLYTTRQGIHFAKLAEGYMTIGPFPEKRTDYLPRILFSEVLAGRTPSVDTLQQTLALPYDRNTITFHIGVTSFIDEMQTRYSYLLEGSSGPHWSSPSGESDIHFVNLPPGRYTLKVRARFLAGDYPDIFSDYAFRIYPPWWQTWWFRAGLALSLMAITFALVRTYIRRRLLHQRLELENQQAIERERTRIATDMHDELGAGLSRIKFLSETIGIKKQQQLPIEEEITGIRRYSHEMIDKMGEIVWALNERNDSLSDLLSYTRSYAAEYLLQAGIRCRVETPAELPSCFVSGEFRRNVYLTIKEALHNIVKHAQAEQVRIRMNVEPGRLLLIRIADDGVGFDRDSIRPFANGLNNMQQRISDLGGTILISGDGGTTITLSVPL
jgi:signal transduction histidine kinase/ligand-binding sensor domain-containing protein